MHALAMQTTATAKVKTTKGKATTVHLDEFLRRLVTLEMRPVVQGGKTVYVVK